MFSASQLTEDQKGALHAWAAEGNSIAELQKRLQEEFGIKITYMDARFLVLDLGVKIVEPAEEGPVAKDEDSAPVAMEAPDAPGGVQVTLDGIAIPGAMISGKVRFSDGENAVWMIDSYGRPGLDPDTPGYRPSPEDIQAFQAQLSDIVRQQGGM